jgi:hypothetical protein
MDDRALMQMALDALKDAALCVQHNSCPPDGGNDWDEQIEALRERLAQPEPEPVAWREIMGKWKTHYYDYNEDGRGEPLYTAPREWVGLTEKEAWECWVSQDHTKSWQNIEAKLREKNHG